VCAGGYGLTWEGPWGRRGCWQAKGEGVRFACGQNGAGNPEDWQCLLGTPNGVCLRHDHGAITGWSVGRGRGGGGLSMQRGFCKDVRI
jgi:hypothetical protein